MSPFEQPREPAERPRTARRSLSALALVVLVVSACDPLYAPGEHPALQPRAPVAGFEAAQIDLLATLSHPGEPPPDPTNRVADDPAAAELGQALFFTDETGPGFIRCPVCHDPQRAFSAAVTYDGRGGLRLRNPPSLLNSAHQRWFFWDGRADSPWAQARTPLEDPEEVGGDRLFLAHAIAASVDLRPRYEVVFGPLPALDDAERFPARGRPGDDPALAAAWDGMTADDQRTIDTILANVGKALAAYQRLLVSTNAPFDRFVTALEAGDAEAAEAAMSPAARRGAALFIGPAGCVGCHNGPLLSDGGFHNLGLDAEPEDQSPTGRVDAIHRARADPFSAAGSFSDAPDGVRATRITRLQAAPGDLGAYRTPSLRDVAQTSPYGRDGRFATLEAMIRYKLDPDDARIGVRSPLLQPVDLPEGSVADLVAFLEALGGAPLDAALLEPPR